MRFHTDKLTRMDVVTTLAEAQAAGEVGAEVTFTDWGVFGSRTHLMAFEVKLGYFEKTAGRTNRRQNRRGDFVPFAATYDEWGHYMARLFDKDPESVWGSRKYGYNGREDFHEKTRHKFERAMV